MNIFHVRRHSELEKKRKFYAFLNSPKYLKARSMPAKQWLRLNSMLLKQEKREGRIIKNRFVGYQHESHQ